MLRKKIQTDFDSAFDFDTLYFMQLNPLQLILHADIVVKGVIVLLLFMSIISWAIIIQKILLFKKIFQNSVKFETFFQGQSKVENIVQASQKASLNPLANLFLDAYQGAKRLTSSKLTPELLEKSLQKSKENELAVMESRISFLATTGSAAPFIGLFGTVWGIMNSFLSIGAKGATSLAVVAPGIAEALIATALGLVAAIPAVIGYNYSVQKLRRIGQTMDNFSADLVDLYFHYFVS